jgi:hypothetical protein
MRTPFAIAAVLLTLAGCLAKTEPITPMAKPEPALSLVALSLEVSPCSSGANDEQTPCLVKATLTEPTTHTDGTQIADLRGVRFSWGRETGARPIMKGTACCWIRLHRMAATHTRSRSTSAYPNAEPKPCSPGRMRSPGRGGAVKTPHSNCRLITVVNLVAQPDRKATCAVQSVCFRSPAGREVNNLVAQK